VTAAPANIGSPLPLIPSPRSISRKAGDLVVDRSTRIAVGAEDRAIGEQLARWLGLPLSAVDVSNAPSEPTNGILLRRSSSSEVRDPAIDPPRATEDEAFALDVSSARAVVHARGVAGLFYGAQTLAQLAGRRRIGQELPPLENDARLAIPCVTLEDAPRFPLRVMHLDVARHFFSKAVVERFVDLMAFYRFNVFHWHLTDDQGFRLAVKARPELTSVGGVDGFYSQQDARDVVRHAKARFITVMPEIEMPGHARAVLAAHPELSCTGKRQEVPRTWGVFDDVLCAGNEQSFVLLEAILKETTEVFPSRIIHIGGDEVPKTRWSACPKCQAAMKAAKTDVAGLEAMFLRRVTTMLAKHGRRAAVWDEGLSPTLARDALVFAWQSRERGALAAKQGFDVVMVPHDETYLNTHQSQSKDEPGHEGLLPWTKVRAFDPLGTVEAAHATRILGGAGALWTEYVTTPDELDTMAMPRMAALAEALWSGGAEKDFAGRFGAQRPVLDASAVHYFVDPPVGLPPRKLFLDGESATLNIERPLLFPDGVIRWTKDGARPSVGSPPFAAPITVEDTTTITASLFVPGGRTSAAVTSRLVKERLREPIPVREPTKGAELAYFEGNFRRLSDLEKVTPLVRGRADGISLAYAERALGARMRREGFALWFEGVFDVPVAGVYRLIAHADDGVRVEVDGEEVVLDDGIHAPRDADGEIALKRGYHRIQVMYFQGTEGKALDLKIEGPTTPVRPFDTYLSTPAPKR
jgi:hexosaminidase